ncbi:MAG: hypothetical protein ACYTFQ_12250 [Planctomycetota bacterium]|jgi:hypothetical protein
MKTKAIELEPEETIRIEADGHLIDVKWATTAGHVSIDSTNPQHGQKWSAGGVNEGARFRTTSVGGVKLVLEKSS